MMVPLHRLAPLRTLGAGHKSDLRAEATPAPGYFARRGVARSRDAARKVRAPRLDTLLSIVLMVAAAQVVKGIRFFFELSAVHPEDQILG